MSSAFISGINFDATNDIMYTKAKVNPNGRKSVGILNKHAKKALYLSTPTMLTWGVNEYVDEKSGSKTYDLALQFPNAEYANEEVDKFLKNMQTLEEKLKNDAIENSKDWLNKAKLTSDAVDALWSPMLKYPKDKESGDFDYSRAPSLKLKLQYWDEEFKNIEVYNKDRVMIYPSEDNTFVPELITKGMHIPTIIQCGGIWVANGKFGVTWKLCQVIVTPTEKVFGKCQIELSALDKEQLEKKPEPEIEVLETPRETAVDDSDDEDTVQQPEPEPEPRPEPEPEPVPEPEQKEVKVEEVKKPKKVVKKKTAASD